MLANSRQAPELQNSLEDHVNDGADPTPLCDSCKNLHFWDGTEQSSILRLLTDEALRVDRLHSLAQMLDNLPTKETCNRLWSQFMATVYPLIPVLHLPTFWRRVDSFWNSIQQYRDTGMPGGILAQSPAFLALIFSTLCCGALPDSSIPTSNDDQDVGDRSRASQLSRSLYRATMATLSLCRFPREPNLISLQAFVICHIPLIREESERSASFVSTAFRVGQALGLHRDPLHFKIETIEAELRRRLWWHILHKDTCK